MLASFTSLCMALFAKCCAKCHHHTCDQGANCHPLISGSATRSLIKMILRLWLWIRPKGVFESVQRLPLRESVQPYFVHSLASHCNLNASKSFWRDGKVCDVIQWRRGFSSWRRARADMPTESGWRKTKMGLHTLRNESAEFVYLGRIGVLESSLK